MKMGKKWEDFSIKVWYNGSVDSWRWPRIFYDQGSVLMKRKQFTFSESFYARYGQLPMTEEIKSSVLAVFLIVKSALDTARMRSFRCRSGDSLLQQEKE